jgi:hypothetical protein
MGREVPIERLADRDGVLSRLDELNCFQMAQMIALAAGPVARPAPSPAVTG